MNTLKMKTVSALEKCFIDEKIEAMEQLTHISMLKNERLSFQIAYIDEEESHEPYRLNVQIEGKLKSYVTIKQVINIPSSMPISRNAYDDNYLRLQPGLFPDAIMPLHYREHVCIAPGNLLSLWVDICLPENIEIYDDDLQFSFVTETGEKLQTTTLRIHVIDSLLMESQPYHTEWFHCDCLAEFYHVPMLSEKHYEIIENFVRKAVENGINVLMMPVFTPALDTYIGGERLTCQLVDIYKQEDSFHFDFSSMDRWIDMCKRCGIEYFEIPPFFTQWGAKAAPKFMAYIEGEYRQLFGWETDAVSTEYTSFLDCFIPALIQELKKHGIDKKTFFHVSDEPDLKDIEHYKAATAVVKKHLKNYTVIDAVWNMEVFELGILSTPVVSISEAENFLKAGAKDIWVYYCGGHNRKVSNRFFAMPTARTRILGVQLYKYDIKGFLHWGYNYYHNRYSYDVINPWVETSGEYFYPSGDAFLVYPGADGKPNESIRLKAMRDAFQDYRALKLCEKLYDREYCISLIQESLDYELTFFEYPHSSAYILKLRESINKAIENAVRK